MMALFSYMQQVQRFIHDTKQEAVDPADIIDYVNRSRREVAMRAQCIRVLTPISGGITSYSIVAAGKNYVNPVVAVSPPDFPSGQQPFPSGAQATATATIQNGTVAQINNIYGGDGYFQPVVTVTDASGSGATISAVTIPVNVLNQGQEIYPFSGINLNRNPGCKSVYSVRGVSIIYSNYRYSLPCYSFSIYQAYIRQYPFQYQWVPTMCSQYGRGAGGSFYVYPLPSQTYQYELDCNCLPSDLTTDQDVEAIPDPWTDAVPFLAACYAYQELQNLNAASYFEARFDSWMKHYNKAALPGRVTNPYGRW